MARKRFEIKTNGAKLNPRQILYVRNDLSDEAQKARMYRGRDIIRVEPATLDRAYDLLLTITDQHLRPVREDRHRIPRAPGISQHFHCPQGLDVYVYGPESITQSHTGLQHIKFRYDAALPLILMSQALHLPSLENAFEMQEEQQKPLKPHALPRRTEHSVGEYTVIVQ